MWIHLPKQFSPSVPDTKVSDLASSSRTLDLSQHVSWNGKLLLPASWSRVSKTASWMTLQFGAISQPSMANRGVAAFIRSLPAIRANRSVAPASSARRKTRVTSGPTSRASSAKSSQSKSSSKMSTHIFDSASMKSPRNWSAWVTALRADSLARRKSARLTEGSDSSRWPSARAEDGESCGNHPGSTDSLTGAARNWTTPTANPGEGTKARPSRTATNRTTEMLGRQAQAWKTPHGFQNTDKNGKTAGGGGEFAKQVMAWQTPATDSFRSRGRDRKDEQDLDQQARRWRTPDSPGAGGPRNRKASIGQGHQTTIAEQAEQWPTPVVGDHRSGVTGKVTKPNARPLCEAVSQFSLPARRTLMHGPGCSCSARMLNPRFVELLMNVPTGWTDASNPLASAVYERWVMAVSLSLSRLRTSRSETPSTRTAP